MGAFQWLPIDEMLQRGSIREVDVLRLKSALHTDGILTAEEAEALCKLNETCGRQDSAWSAFYVEAITDYVVNQVEPEGYLTAEKARKLIERVARDGKVACKTNLDLVVNVLDKSRWAPVSLSRFALQQICYAVASGEGPLRFDQPRRCGTINEHEVELVRRILYAFGGDGNVAMTRAEAEVLFDINDAITDPQANPAWTDLFVKVVTNLVMAASGQAVPTREEALRPDDWQNEMGELLALASLAAMVSSSMDAVRDAYQEQSTEERALARLEQQRIEIITNEEIARAEAGWLCERIGRDGHLRPNEAALIAYLRKERPRIHPDLQAAVERLAQAA